MTGSTRLPHCRAAPDTVAALKRSTASLLRMQHVENLRCYDRSDSYWLKCTHSECSGVQALKHFIQIICSSSPCKGALACCSPGRGRDNKVQIWPQSAQVVDYSVLADA